MDELDGEKTAMSQQSTYCSCVFSLSFSSTRFLLSSVKNSLDECPVILYRSFGGQEVLSAVTIQTSSADIFLGGFASIYSPEPHRSLGIVALYLDVIPFSLNKVSVSMLEDVISDPDLTIAKNVFSRRAAIRVEKLFV